jgi:hypothetical protein
MHYNWETNVVQITTLEKEVGPLDDVGLEVFKQGTVVNEEEHTHAIPQAQWATLENYLIEKVSISHLSQVMREICDAVDHEVSREVCLQH